MNMSPRQQVAQNLADTCVFGELNESYGVSVEKAKDKSGKEHWSVLFAKARTLDGVIRVYSPGFILITWQGTLARDTDLPLRGSQLCKSEYEAKAFLVKHFVNK
jgi:hypothetical protein